MSDHDYPDRYWQLIPDNFIRSKGPISLLYRQADSN
jgi:hypothetical protein